MPSGAAEPRFSFVHVLYYLGGMVAIGAMSIFMTLGWNALGGWGGFVTAVLYAVLALSLTHWFLEKKHLEIPAGITATLAVVMVPLAIFFAQMALGYWGENKPFRDYHVYIDWRWIMMEFGTLAVGAILLWRYRFPFMLMPVAVTLWYMSMDMVPFLFGAERVYDWEIRKFISLWFGLAMVLVAFFIVEGIASILGAIQHRRHLRSWVWVLFSGVVDLLLAWLIWAGWPSSADWAIGLLVGINMIFFGLSLVMTALAARVMGNQGPRPNSPF